MAFVHSYFREKITGMSRAWILVLALVIGWVRPTQVLAWSEGGHKIAALLAYDHLDPAQRSQVMSVLRSHPLWHEFFEAPLQAALGPNPKQEEAERWLLAQAAIWPDLVRPAKGSPPDANPYKAYHHPTWHYIDLPEFRQDEDRKHLGYRLSDPPEDWKPGDTEPKEGWNAVQILKKAHYEWTSKQESPAERAVMLCWLMHLVGDVHQPCHCAELYWPHKLPKGDRGANDLSLWSMGGKSLHAYWDGLFDARGVSLSVMESWTVTLNQEPHGAPGQRPSASWAPEAWAKEGWAAAREYVYPASLMVALDQAQAEHPAGGGHAIFILRLPEADLQSYEQKAEQCAHRQILLAGDRLAEALRAAAH